MYNVITRSSSKEYIFYGTESAEVLPRCGPTRSGYGLRRFTHKWQTEPDRDRLSPWEGELTAPTDESRGLLYYSQMKTGETVWEWPDRFVIPLGILQVKQFLLMPLTSFLPIGGLSLG